jgi:hypothetical protein
MANLHTSEGATYLLQIFSSAFLGILFLQSGIDKVVDWDGNFEWLKGHFAKSPLAGMVTLLMAVLTVMEIATGACSAVGCVLVILKHDSTLAFYGAALAALSLIALLFGQRVAKDYSGAATLVPYFLLALSALYLLA